MPPVFILSDARENDAVILVTPIALSSRRARFHNAEFVENGWFVLPTTLERCRLRPLDPTLTFGG